MSGEHILEAAVLKDTLKWLDDQALTYTLRINDNHKKGIPDIIICRNGKYVVIELKRPGGEATPHQLKRIAKIQKANGYGRVCESLVEVKRFMMEVDMNVR